MQPYPSPEEEIRRLGFDTDSALMEARAGRIEEWVHRYLLSGNWANPGFSEGLKQKPRWWIGPVEVKLSDLSPAVGIEPWMECVVSHEYWEGRTRRLAASFTDPLALPPLIAEYRAGELSVRDGNTRLGAMKLLGWLKCWVIIWFNTEEEWRLHQETFIKAS